MNLLGELVNATWLRLEDLLKDLDEPDEERQVFIDDTRQFFEQRLSIYVKKRLELETSIKELEEKMYQLFDKLELPRVKYSDREMTLIEKQKSINDKINELNSMVIENDKKLAHLRQSIIIKAKLIGNNYHNVDEISSTNQAYGILSNLANKLKNLKEDIRVLLRKTRSLNSDSNSNSLTLAESFLSLSDDNESSWLSNNHPLTGLSLYSQLLAEYKRLEETLMTEIIRLRTELGQKEPSPPNDLKEELANLRLRKRYLSLLSNFPHKLTSNSSLDEIRQTYEQLTASLRAKAREKLEHLWNQLDVPKDQRIIPKTNDNQDDYLLMNDEISRLEQYIESIRPLLTKIQKREWYKREMIEFEKRAGDPARLRGNSMQLLKEERFRKDLAREFPKLTDDLRYMVAEWEESSRKKLIYGGEPYLETMNKEKLSVDFELLHLRLLTKCQVLAQGKIDEATSLENNNELSSSKSSSSQTINLPTSPSSPPPPLTQKTTATSRIPTMNFTNSTRKINKQL